VVTISDTGAESPGHQAAYTPFATVAVTSVPSAKMMVTPVTSAPAAPPRLVELGAPPEVGSEIVPGAAVGTGADALVTTSGFKPGPVRHSASALAVVVGAVRMTSVDVPRTSSRTGVQFPSLPAKTLPPAELLERSVSAWTHALSADES
jgi:hypothetical protein